MKLTICITTLLFIFQFGYTQNIERQVISSSGESLANGSHRLDFTIGELAVSTITNDHVLSQGFHQGDLLLSIKINPVFFLQGPYMSPVTGGLMNDDLRAILSTTSPYLDGLMCDSSVFTVTGSDAIVDWVLVEIRDAADRTIIIESRSALLQRDGNVVDIDGFSAVSFASPGGSYFVLLNHRNHLGIMSANPIALSGTTGVDLSADPSAVFGGTNAVQNMNGVYAAFSGDFDGNGQVQNSDATEVLLLLGSSGYSFADMDMNGQVQITDINNVITPNTGRGEQF